MIVCFAVLLLASCGNGSKQEELVKYETMVVKADTLTYKVFIPASLHGIQEVEVLPQVSGIIRQVNFTDGVKVSKGQTYKHQGTVTEIGGIVDRQTGTVICKCTFPNPEDELRSGLSGTLVFPTKIKKAFRIPRTAAVRLQDQLMFYRVKKDGTVEGVLCDAIPSNSGNHYYVKNGLRNGDEVVVTGAHKLSNGMKIR